MKLTGTETEKNLLKAFAGESQARNRYEFFAKAARTEGYEQIASVFMLTADNEKAHAKRFFRFLEGNLVEITATYPAGKIGTTAENLLAAVMGENEEWTELYPHFAAVAVKEGFKDVAAAFKIITKIEEHHEQRFRKLLKDIETNQVFNSPEKIEWICRECGYIHFGNKALENCPSCLHPKAYFEKYIRY